MHLFVVTPEGIKEGMPLAKANGALHVPLLTDSDSEPCLRVVGFEPQTTEILQASLLWDEAFPTLVPEKPDEADRNALVLIRVPVRRRDRSNRGTQNLLERFVENNETTTRVWIVTMTRTSEIRTYFYEGEGEINRPLWIHWDGMVLTRPTK